ncbi:MAG: molybdopterin converting factor subunit 1 [Burkholderiales bacterium]|nr:molybdopterin converting factor subunit 1 [Burkholderiales bacterium]
MPTLLYFARLRETFGVEREDAPLPSPATVAGLLDALRARGGPWALELAPGRAYRVAVNQRIANADTLIAAADEVALFPPVTGG